MTTFHSKSERIAVLINDLLPDQDVQTLTMTIACVGVELTLEYFRDVNIHITPSLEKITISSPDIDWSYKKLYGVIQHLHHLSTER